MAFDLYYDLLWKRQHRFGIALTLLIYSICYFICDYFYIHEAPLLTHIDINNLYIISSLAISVSTFLLIIFDTILNKTNTILRIFISVLMIIGGLLYFTLTLLESLQTHQNTSQNTLLYTLLYLSTAFFICCNTIVLSIINLFDCYHCKTILLINSIILIITSSSMIYFWSVYYTNSSISPTQMQIGLIQTGWIIIATISCATVIYELMNSKHIPFLRILSVFLIIGGFLVFSGSSAFSADIIFFNDDLKNNFIIQNNIEIVIEWSLAFSIFISCIALSSLIIRSNQNKHFTHLTNVNKHINNKQQLNIQKKISLSYKSYKYALSDLDGHGFDIMLQTEPSQPLWADV
eukprot:30191_1